MKDGTVSRGISCSRKETAIGYAIRQSIALPSWVKLKHFSRTANGEQWLHRAFDSIACS
jgi:hypothetical protein